MSRKTNLMLGLITVSMVVRAISSILASKKVAQTQGVGNFYTLTLDTKTDGKGVFRVEHGLNSECKPVKGLYAAGNNAGGRFIVAYQTPFAGISVGMAITEGYMLGERLAGL